MLSSEFSDCRSWPGAEAELLLHVQDQDKFGLVLGVV